MYRISAICAIVHLLTTTAGSPTADHKTGLSEHYQHVEYISDFPCGVPQPRVISVKDLFCESETKGKAYDPDITVLHRCDNTGYCTTGQTCGPVTQGIHVLFRVTFLEDIAQHNRGTWTMEYHELKNHTECACVDAPPHTGSLDQATTVPCTLLVPSQINVIEHPAVVEK